MYPNKTAKLIELRKELQLLRECKPQLRSTSVEEVDDAYQQALEWNYEFEAIRDEIERVKAMKYVEFDKLYNAPEEAEIAESKHGDEWELEDVNC